MFTTLPDLGVVGGFTIGVFGDLGDTYNSSTTLNHLQANSPQVILNVGDLVRTCPDSERADSKRSTAAGLSFGN